MFPPLPLIDSFKLDVGITVIIAYLSRLEIEKTLEALQGDVNLECEV